MKTCGKRKVCHRKMVFHMKICCEKMVWHMRRTCHRKMGDCGAKKIYHEMVHHTMTAGYMRTNAFHRRKMKVCFCKTAYGTSPSHMVTP